MTKEQINFKTGKEYKGYNQAFLTIAYKENNYKSNEWGTFLQLKEAGKEIKKGSKGVAIKIVVENNKIKNGKAVIGKAVFYKSVFNKEQTETNKI